MMDNKQGRSRFSRYLLLFLLSGVFMLGNSVMAEVLTVKVMSYNTALIRGGTEQDISSLAALIQSEAPAIINIQELGSANRNLLETELAGLGLQYTFYYVNDSNNDPILINTSETSPFNDENIISGYAQVDIGAAGCGRTGYTWAVVEADNGQQFAIYNAHLCINSALDHATAVLEGLLDNGHLDLPLIFSGDMNTSERNNPEALAYLLDGEVNNEGNTNPVALYDTNELLTGVRGATGIGIDWIFINDDAGNVFLVTDTATVDDSGLSDHDPITATVLLNDPGNPPFGPALVSATADDPDDADVVYSDDDTVTIEFSTPTNKPDVSNSAAIAALFDMTSSLGDALTGVWDAEGDTLTITIDTIAATEPAIGTFEIGMQAGNSLRSDDGDSQEATGSATLNGDWGNTGGGGGPGGGRGGACDTDGGPVLISFTAIDASGNPGYEVGDQVELVFDIATNMYPTGAIGDVFDKTGVDEVFSFAPRGAILADDYNGMWTSNSTLVITITDDADPAPGSLRVRVQSNCILQDEAETTGASSDGMVIMDGSF